MVDAAVFDEALLARFPLPLAQLFRRSLNSKTPLEQHLGGLYLAEMGLKLLGSGAIVEYAALGRSDAQLHSCLENLARPSLGHWWEFSRKLVPVLADAGCPGYDAVRQLLLGPTRDDMPRAAGLDSLLREVLKLGSGARATVRLSELFDRLVQLRNKFGHGAQAAHREAFHQPLGAALVSGLAEVYGRLDVLAGGRLIYVGDVRQSAGSWIVERWELSGEHPRRQPALELPRADLARLPDGQRAYLARGSGADECLRPLYPLLLYDAEAEETLVLNARRGRQQVEWLSYTSGRELRQEAALDGQHLALLAQLLHIEVDAQHAGAWADRSMAEEPPIEAAVPYSQRTLGEFELISELGRGGMGVVYRAWQPSLGRQVAVKKLLDSSEKSARRFTREIRALGRVEHPNLVKVYTSGSVGDDWFYAMELVDGAPLSNICRCLEESGTHAGELNLETWHDAVSTACSHARQSERQLAPGSSDGGASAAEKGSAAESRASRPLAAAEARATPQHLHGGRGYIANVAELVRQAAEAAHALHEAGVVHRDIKPGNIMVGVDGRQAVLMDLGLAQLADDEDGNLTRTRQFIGTLRYASPQQVLAAERLDRRSDVYSLGATLWELLALRPLFEATDDTPTPQLMERILHEDPAPLARFHANIPRDLAAIVARCLEKRPERRYASARDLALDLARFLRGEPVQARPVRPLVRAMRWIARRPALAAAWSLSLLAVVLVAGGGGAVLLWQQAEQGRQDAERHLALGMAPPPSLEGEPEVGEVYPAVEDFVPDEQLIRARPAGWLAPTEVDFRCSNETGEADLLLICNLTNHYQISENPADDSPISSLLAGEWRLESLNDPANRGPKRIPLYTGLGWYVLFMRTSYGDKPLYQRNDRGADYLLGPVNLCTAKHIVLTVTTGSFGGKKRYYASIVRHD